MWVEIYMTALKPGLEGLRPRATIWALGVAVLLTGAAWADPPGPARYKAGTELETLTAGKISYRQVVIKSITARTVMFLHRDGMVSVRLRELSPELQAQFGYDAVAESASEQALQRATAERQAQLAAAAQTRAASAAQTNSQFDRVLQEFGQPAVLQPEVDLRPRFRELELYAKNQGRRPSCAVFAVVSALEFIHAENTGLAEKFSEEYLIWATQRSIQRTDRNPGESLIGDDADTGFALTEVVTALRSYGIPRERSMPNTMGRAIAAVAEPTPQIIAEARARTRVAVQLVPGRDQATQLNNIVHALNAGLPVTIGTAWPRFFNMRAALLNSQEPSYSHAVTLVGYRCPSGRLEDATFIFKNSWGANWGANGYGFATFAYLVKHLHTAVLLEIRLRD